MCFSLVCATDSTVRYDAFYKLQQPAHQIQSMVEDVVRGAVPGIDLDSIFLQKQQIAQTIQDALEKDMHAYGYAITASLVTDISPDLRVKASMNEINANRRLRIAQTEKAEAEKIVHIKKAEAQSEATYLQGQGVARQRKAIVDGMRTSVEEFSRDVDVIDAKDVIQLIVVNQYFDTMKEIARGENSNIIFAPKRRK
eukprot:GHVT01045927.1.p1 GENE.GHVT01045927.1~~GHVT01045927.1.p1  ORF type:complete len:197 (-),score=22.04 GHVT01045927.1:634-1224(-)